VGGAKKAGIKAKSRPAISTRKSGVGFTQVDGIHTAEFLPPSSEDSTNSVKIGKHAEKIKKI
jgi:hypothetical protein